MGSLQDALLKSGLASQEKLDKEKIDKEKRHQQKRERARRGKKAAGPSDRRHADKKSTQSGRRKQAGQGAADKAPGKPQKTDLERAWIARRKAEQAEKERVKQARVADQEARRLRNLKLDKIVEGKVLNVEEAEIPRYFEHLGRIRRVLCTAEQRQALNEARLGLVNLRGRYLIVEPEVLEQYRQLADDLVPDLTGAEPEDESESGDYPPVPDDITW